VCVGVCVCGCVSCVCVCVCERELCVCVCVCVSGGWVAGWLGWGAHVSEPLQDLCREVLSSLIVAQACACIRGDLWLPRSIPNSTHKGARARAHTHTRTHTTHTHTHTLTHSHTGYLLAGQQPQQTQQPWFCSSRFRSTTHRPL
jgi:hypothetical protein